MSPEERDLITGLFDRMRSYGRPEKDFQAESLINQSIRQNPDAAYMLVQSVLVQDQALQQADERIKELEARNAELEDYFARQQPQQPQQSSGGGFLGGLFGGNKSAAQAPAPRGPTSVPTAGAGPWGRPQPQAAQPWGNQQAPASPMSSPMQQPAQAQAAQKTGGGFMKTAMATAAGVAGGMILADSIRGMMGGGSGSASASQPGGTDGWGSSASSSDTGFTNADNNDPGTYDPTPTANYDGADYPSDGGGGGGGDFDVDI